MFSRESNLSFQREAFARIDLGREVAENDLDKDDGGNDQEGRMDDGEGKTEGAEKKEKGESANRRAVRGVR